MDRFDKISVVLTCDECGKKFRTLIYDDDSLNNWNLVLCADCSGKVSIP